MTPYQWELQGSTPQPTTLNPQFQNMTGHIPSTDQYGGVQMSTDNLLCRRAVVAPEKNEPTNFEINGKSYKLYKKKPLLTKEVARNIILAYILPHKGHSGWLQQWNASQTRLLQFAVSVMIQQLSLEPKLFEKEHWDNIAKKYFMGICTGAQCHKRWLYT